VPLYGGLVPPLILLYLTPKNCLELVNSLTVEISFPGLVIFVSMQEIIQISTPAQNGLYYITRQVEAIVAESGVQTGMVNVNPGRQGGYHGFHQLKTVLKN